MAIGIIVATLQIGYVNPTVSRTVTYDKIVIVCGDTQPLGY